MCGIVGIVDRSSRSLSALKASFYRMNESMAHRGPDDWGLTILQADQAERHSMSCPEGDIIPRGGRMGGGRGGVKISGGQTVMLGQRRLAIIDLSFGGHQPMRTKDGRFWMIYNGEIYNHRELRGELESSGVSFSSTSDTEVLLSLYAREGSGCLRKLRGMFAFVVWDEDQQELFLARDRFGMKPLYYAQTSCGSFLFSSELKGILSSGFVSRDIDEESELDFLQRGSISAPRTFYQHIKALPPAHWARWDGKRLGLESYWSLSGALAGQSDKMADTRDVAHRVRCELVESVKAHMVSDVPVGVFLSGGLDSAAIVASIRQFYSGPLKTFTMTFPGTELDESHLARQAATYYGTDHTEIEVTQEDFYHSLDDMFLAMDQPTVDGVNTYFVAKAARQAGAKVVLSGLGGDEILGGYKSFVDVPRLRKYLRAARFLPWGSDVALSFLRRLPASWAPKLIQLWKNTSDNLEDLWHGYRALFTDEQIRELQVTNGRNRPSPPFPFPSEMNHPFWSIALMEMERFMIPQLLRDADVFTMCHGLELRTPFVDHIFLRTVREAGAWSRERAPSHKMALLRRMGDFLPPEHIKQKKMGFTLPFEVWLRERLLNDASSGRECHVRSSLDKPRYRSLIEEFVQGKVHWSRIWSLYVLERFRTQPDVF